jgi:hypothetical protein
MMIEAPGFHKIVTSLYPENDEFLSSDAVFGVKKSLVVVSMWLVVRPQDGLRPHLFISPQKIAN